MAVSKGLGAIAALAARLCVARDLDALRGVLADVREALDARELLVDVTSLTLQRPALVRLGVDEAWAARYNAEFHALNPASATIAARVRAGGLVAARFVDLCAEPLAGTRFFQEYMQPQRHRDSLVGALSLEAAAGVTQAIVLLVVRYDDQADFEPDACAAVVLLMPALALAVQAAMRQSRDWTHAVVRDALGLTGRLAEVAVLIAEGAANQEIATRLGLTLATVKGYVHDTLERTGASSRTDLARLVRG